MYFDRLLEDVAGAKSSIHIESFIWWAGDICDRIGEALIRRAREGVEVRLMLVIDAPVVQHASHHHYGDLLAAGVRIFEYRKTLLHQKIIIVDRKWSCIGSTNFDDRSFELNDEITVGFTDPEIAQKLHHAFENDLKDSVEIHLNTWKTRPWYHKLEDGAAFIFRREL